jgi:pantoate--beta-alanine ligase
MQIITRIEEMKQYSRRAWQNGKTIGFVPTMGYLHDGHMSLISAARKECDVVVVSIFVNPAQFGPGEDFDKYPRDMERDSKIAEEAGADCIFNPETEAMYPGGCITYIEVKGLLAEGLCARSRPGHFRGVATIVAKLFNIVMPDKSYFGQKDAQQAAIIRKMVQDLNMDTEICIMPIVREEDDLAMSSRNTYLSEKERHQALGIYHSLDKAQELVSRGTRSVDEIKKEMKGILLEGDKVRVDYIEAVDAVTFQPLEKVKDNTLIAVAAFVGDTRLIDNIVIRIQG